MTQDPLAFRWGLGFVHRLQPFGLHGLVESWAGFGAGLDGDRGRGIPRPRVGLASSAGGFSGVDGGALGDGDVDEGLDGVVLCGRLRGGGSRCGAGGSVCVGCGVLAWVLVRVWVGAGQLLLPLRLLRDVWGGVGGVGDVEGGVVVRVPVFVWGLVLGWGPVRG